MKNRLLSTVLLASWATLVGPPSCHDRKQPEQENTTTMPEKLQNDLTDVPIDNFVGRTAGELLDSIPEKYEELVFTDTGRPGILEGAQFRYGKIWLRIKLGDLQHLTRFNEKYDWDLELFRKETVASAEWAE